MAGYSGIGPEEGLKTLTEAADIATGGGVSSSVKHPIIASTLGPQAAIMKGSMEGEPKIIPDSLSIGANIGERIGKREFPNKKELMGYANALPRVVASNLIPLVIGEVGKTEPYLNTKAGKAAQMRKAQKLTGELLGVSTKSRGGVIPESSIQGARVIGKSKDWVDLHSKIKSEKSRIMDLRNKRIAENNFSVGRDYIDRSVNNINEERRLGRITDSQYNQAMQTLSEESKFFNENLGRTDRLWLQKRKETLQNLAEPFLEKSAGGKTVSREPGKSFAYDTLQREALKDVAGNDKILYELNSRYAGLNEAEKLAFSKGRKAEGIKKPTLVQQLIPITYLPSTRFSAVSQVAREAALAGASLPRTTAKIEYLRKLAGEAPISTRQETGLVKVEKQLPAIRKRISRARGLPEPRPIEAMNIIEMPGEVSNPPRLALPKPETQYPIGTKTRFKGKPKGEGFETVSKKKSSEMIKGGRKLTPTEKAILKRLLGGE